MYFEIEQKSKGNVDREIKVKSPQDVYEISEIQEIKNAVQEHLIYLGLNNANIINNIKIIGIGNSKCIQVDSKDIIRTALINADDKVILVHNHPSNTLVASSHDIHLSNVTKKLLEVFGIDLLDHIIVTERAYLSMEKAKDFNEEYSNDSLDKMDKGFLLERNMQLEQENKELVEKVEQYESENEDDMEM